METRDPNMIFPRFTELWCCYEEKNIFKLPIVLFDALILKYHPHEVSSENYHFINIWQDTLPDKTIEEQKIYLEYLQNVVTWDQVGQFLTLPPDTWSNLLKIWSEKKNNVLGYRFSFHHKMSPHELFRYMKFDDNRLSQLFVENKLYLPHLGSFNDPFDCGLDEHNRLSFIEYGIGCFSEKNTSTLLFSHYADNHRGFCLGVNPLELVKSLEDNNEKVDKADIRPVWYYPRVPPFDFKRDDALWATCKNEDWRYEDEYRLFLINGKLLHGGLYYISPESISSVTFGCRASDECIACVKRMTRNHPNIEYYKACKKPTCFDLDIRKIERI